MQNVWAITDANGNVTGYYANAAPNPAPSNLVEMDISDPRIVAFLAIVPPVTVNSFQAKAALQNAGLYTSVNNYMINSAPIIDQLAWTNAPSFTRNDAIIANLQTALGLTNAQLDALFAAAELIVI